MPTERLGRVDIGGGRTRLQIRCACGAKLTCMSFTNTCDCGRDYNTAGQLLASREQWGEETGETAGDVLVSDDALVRSLDDDCNDYGCP
jgi:hypothetical protein